MKIAELIERLRQHPQDAEVMILDSFNGGGCPREINLGPVARTVSSEDAEETCDCEGLEGESVIVIGFGSY